MMRKNYAVVRNTFEIARVYVSRIAIVEMALFSTVHSSCTKNGPWLEPHFLFRVFTRTNALIVCDLLRNIDVFVLRQRQIVNFQSSFWSLFLWENDMKWITLQYFQNFFFSLTLLKVFRVWVQFVPEIGSKPLLPKRELELLVIPFQKTFKTSLATVNAEIQYEHGYCSYFRRAFWVENFRSESIRQFVGVWLYCLAEIDELEKVKM